MNALHLRQYQEYYNAIEKIVTGSNASTYYEELAALNKAAEMKPRVLVCAPSNAGIDNVILKIMSDKFVDGQGGKYCPSITRVGAGITCPKIESVTLKQSVDNIIAQGCDVTRLENTIVAQRQNLQRIQKEMHKLRTRLKAMVDCCPYEISSEWEIRIDEASFESTGQVLFVNHSTKMTTFDVPPKVRPNETPCIIHQMPHYRSLLKSLTKYVERHNNETSNLEKYIMLQNAVNSNVDGGGSSDRSIPVALLEERIAVAVLNSSHIVLTTLGSAGGRAMASANRFPIKWKLDKTGFTEYTFKGFESGNKPSEVSGLNRLYYDRSKPFTKTVKVVDRFVPELFIEKPKAYIIPQGWWKVIDRLMINKVQMSQLQKDTTLEVEWYTIEDYKTTPRQYEMHHLNSDVVVRKQKAAKFFRKGDWIIQLNQPANRFLVETLEPQAEDSYFAWNFFDAILGQKEGYSAYVFEDKAAQYLKENPTLKKQLEQRRATDTLFAKSARAQLDFVYKNSPWAEPDYNRYPVFRVLQ